ncbi:MAG: NADP-dependent isocitrate dehydrogenase [Leptospiraceae bacterium]|nr:NADP-dependent isocitrate dehydrogenase [Leptospiraceae bacterium]MDW8306544.1 NADP-dependent isocitrate dehydrogenase [Leptospiraceae bacterium]
MSSKIPITIAKGDGIGPEIMDAVLAVLHAADVPLEYHFIDIGEKVYLAGNTSGIDEKAWETILKTRVLLKAPITTPQGGGYKSLNVTMRKMLSLYANVRPCVAYHPFVETRHPQMDLVIIRENEEDLYAGIEHRQTPEVVQCLKLVSRPGCERIIRYAFEYARAYGRKKVSCMTKDNIMKMTDGLFHHIFNEIGKEYPDIEKDHYIIDIGSARIADTPERFDVIVTLNLYGDIISDIAAQIAGSVGLAGSANIGLHAAMFEAIHGSAPDIAGKGIANPSGLLQAAVMMLVHVGLAEKAELIQNAWLRTIEEGIHTNDIFREGKSRRKVTTREFAEAVIANLGKKPEQLKGFRTSSYRMNPSHALTNISVKKELVGVDVFVEWPTKDPASLGELLEAIEHPVLKLKMISNRGLKVYPNPMAVSFCTDHFRCRFVSKTDKGISHQDILVLLDKIGQKGIDFIKTENLYTFDGVNGFTLSQGE